MAGALHYLQGEKPRSEHTNALAEIVLRQSRREMDIALKAAETGHILLATLHTPDVARTVGRIVSLTQQSDPSEALVVTGTARESIRKPERSTPLEEVMERGVHPYGMQTFEMHLRHLVSAGRVAVALARQALG